MYKYLFTFCCLIYLSFSGCSQLEVNKTPSTIYDEGLANNNLFIHSNDYFFQGDNIGLVADVTTNNNTDYEKGDSPSPIKIESSNINVNKVFNIKNGTVYKLVIDPVEDNDGYISATRLNMYFYVTVGRIYRIWSYVYEDSILNNFYDNDSILINLLDTEEKIIDNSYLVCQKDALCDALGENEVGIHTLIEIDGDSVTSRMWEVSENGETYFYESFSWKLGSGLVTYRSGFRSERDILYLDKISLKKN